MAEMTPITTYPALVGSVLAQLRLRAKLTQGDLAKAIGIAPSTWSRIENGENSLSVEQLKLAADALKTSAPGILELADRAEEATKAKGIQLERFGVLRNAGPVSKTIAGAALAAGHIPMIGQMLAGIAATVVAAETIATMAKKK